MKGWKTKLGFILKLLSCIVAPEFEPLVSTVGDAFLGVGIAHKVEKAGKVILAREKFND